MKICNLVTFLLISTENFFLCTLTGASWRKQGIDTGIYRQSTRDLQEMEKERKKSRVKNNNKAKNITREFNTKPLS